MTEQKSETERKAKLLPSRLKILPQVVNDWSAVVEGGVPFEHVSTVPGFWSHTAARLRQGDIIHVRADDGAYYGRLYVRAVERMGAHVVVLEHVDFAKLAPVENTDDEHIVKFGGPHKKWEVLRVKDGVAVQSGLDSRASALAAMSALASGRRAA